MSGPRGSSVAARVVHRSADTEVLRLLEPELSQEQSLNIAVEFHYRPGGYSSNAKKRVSGAEQSSRSWLVYSPPCGTSARESDIFGVEGRRRSGNHDC